MFCWMQVQFLMNDVNIITVQNFLHFVEIQVRLEYNWRVLRFFFSKLIQSSKHRSPPEPFLLPMGLNLNCLGELPSCGGIRCLPFSLSQQSTFTSVTSTSPSSLSKLTFSCWQPYGVVQKKVNSSHNWICALDLVTRSHFWKDED